MFATEARVWMDENVGLPIIDFDEEGRRIVRAAAPVIALRPEWFATHYGLSEMWQADGTVWLDSAGRYRYEKLRDLPDGAVAYRRVDDDPTDTDLSACSSPICEPTAS